MITIRPALFSILAIVAGAILSGCATTQPVAYRDLASASQLEAGASTESAKIPFEYSAEVNWGDYTDALLEPVAIYRGKDQQFEKVSEAEKRELARYMQERLLRTLGSSRLAVAREAQSRTVRIRVTLTGAKPTAQVVGTAMRFDLAGGTYNLVQSARGREGAFTGSVTYAVEIFDAASGQLLSAYIGKQYPNAMNVKATVGRLEAAKVGIDKAADELVRRLN